MDLQADATALFYTVVGFGVIGRLEAVDREANALALAADRVLVPVVVLHQLFDDFPGRLREYLVSPRLVVKRPPVVLPHVGLVTDHFVVIRNPFGAELYSGVGAGRVTTA